jgi:Sulfate permease family
MQPGKPTDAELARGWRRRRCPISAGVPCGSGCERPRAAGPAADLAVSAGVIVVVLAARAFSRKIPGLLIAVITAIVVSRAADLAGHGVAVLGPVPGGLPSLGLPALDWHDAALLVGAALSMCVVILAQSAATSRAYANPSQRPGQVIRHADCLRQECLAEASGH